MTAVCPGSYDPVTVGHLDVITRAEALFGDVIVAVGQNSSKSCLFDIKQRIAMLEAAIAEIPSVRTPNAPATSSVRVLPLTGLLVDFCRSHGADVIVKGIRFASDLDYELQMAHVNAELTGVETVLLPSSREWGTISSTMVRDVFRHGGDVSAFVPSVVAELIGGKAPGVQKEGTHG